MSETRSQTCSICPHACSLADDRVGICGMRVGREDGIASLTYGRLSSCMLDPIEKKPIACYRPGSLVLSVGGYGCNLSCSFCQNYEIAHVRAVGEISGYFIPPEDLIEIALIERTRGNIGLAYTYNEPFISWEYMRDCSVLAHEKGLINLAVTNGYVQPTIWEQSLSLIDVFNIDLKCFSEEGYQRLAAPHGLEIVKGSIHRAYEAGVHIEVTTLVVPGFSDDERLFAQECEWLASLDENIPLHISRFFPCYKMYDSAPTSTELLFRFHDIATQILNHVFLGNI